MLSGKLKNKPEKTIQFKNLPQNYEAEYNVPQLGKIDNAFDSEFQRNLISKIRNKEDVQI